MASEQSRKGMRGHDANGNVRPADDRFDLHRPEDESQVCRTDRAKEKRK